MVHRGQAGPAGVRVDAEHVEVVPAPVRRHQQHPARVELQGDDGLRVRYEVSHDRIAGVLAVLAVFVVIALGKTKLPFVTYLPTEYYTLETRETLQPKR